MINHGEKRNFANVLVKAEAQNKRVFIILYAGKEYFEKVKQSDLLYLMISLFHK